MNSNPHIHYRRSIRLKGYDYSRPGLYFVTICTTNRLSLFGHIENRDMVLNDVGKMVNIVWNEMPNHYKGIGIHEFIVMPNHVHGIIEIESNSMTVGAGPCACSDDGWQKTEGQPQGVAPTMSLSDIVHRFKTLTTKRYIDGVNHNEFHQFNKRLWQRNYYEHVIRNEKSYHDLSEYIMNNPINWQEDRYYIPRSL